MGFFCFFLKEKSSKLTLQTSSRAGLRAGLLSSPWSPPRWIGLFHCSGIGSARIWICGTGPLKKAYDTNSLSPNSASVCLPSDNWREEKPNPRDTHLVHDWRIYDRTQFPPFVWQRAAGLCDCVSAFLPANASSWIQRTGNDLAKGFWWQLTEFLLITFFCPLPQNILTASPKSLRSGIGGGWLQIFDECVMERLLFLLKVWFIFLIYISSVFYLVIRAT